MVSSELQDTKQLFTYLLSQIGEVQKLKLDLAEAQSQGSVNDSIRVRAYDEPMNEITREEFNAKLETIEVKMDARVESVSAKIDAFLSAQAERDKAQLERDKRYELLADRVTKAAEGAEEAAKQAATVKSNYWAAVGVQLLAVAAILVGAYFATQANTLSAISTTLSAFQAGKGEPAVMPPAPTSQQPLSK